jgi:hypothetical protein
LSAIALASICHARMPAMPVPLRPDVVWTTLA